MPIFRFRQPQREAHPQPLATQKSAAAWFRQLPAVDAIGRQQVVTRAIETACRSANAFTFEQIGAIEFLDAELANDRGRLISQYVEHAEGSAALANRIWQAAFEICQAFVAAYRSLLERALDHPADPRWSDALPRLFARLIHFHGTDAKLRVLKNEPWIPAKWMELHRLYARARELGVERSALPADPASASAPRPTVEQEYVAVLLTHQLNTGTLVPREIDWASAQVHAWAERLALDAEPHAPGGFVVDFAGRQGLVRRTGGASGAALRFLDTGPVIEQLDGAIAALRRLAAADPDGAGPVSRQRIQILERLRPVLSPVVPDAVPREPRTGVALSAQLRVGLPQIYLELAAGDVHDAAVDFATEGDAAVEPAAGIGSATAPRGVPRGEELWRVVDRSGTGLRIAAPSALGQGLTLGMLVAVRERGEGGWLLGAVRRVARPGPERIEAGISILALRAIPVALHAKRQAREEMGFIVDGVDVSTIGERFDGLYVPPPSRPDRPLGAKTLIIPTSEFGAGRNVVLITTRTVYTVALREPLERHPEWTWVAIDVVERKARG